MKDIKVFLKKKKTKERKKVSERYQNVPEEQKQKLLEYMKKIFIYHIKSNYWVTLKILGQSNLFHGLIFEM